MSTDRLARAALFTLTVLLCPAVAQAYSWTWIGLIDKVSKHLRAGDFAQAEEAARQALDEAKRLGGDEGKAAMQSLAMLAQIVGGRGRYSEAEDLQRQALAIVEKHEGPDHRNTGHILSGLAGILTIQWRVSEAESLARRGLAIVEKAEGAEDRSVVSPLSILGGILRLQGRLSEAEQYLRRAQKIAEDTNHPDKGGHGGNLAVLLSEQGNYRDAETLLRRNVELAEKRDWTGNPDLPLKLTNLALILAKQGKYAEAEPLSRRALAMSAKVRGPETDSTLGHMMALAEVLSAQGKHDEVEQIAGSGLALAAKLFGEDHFRTRSIAAIAVPGLEQKNEYEKAGVLLSRAYDASKKSGSAQPGQVMRTAGALGTNLVRRGRLKEALPYFREAVGILDFLFSQTRGLREEARQGFLAQHGRYYREMIELLLRLEREEPNAGHGREALAVASQNQSRIFSEMLRQSDVARFAKDPKFLSLKQSRDSLLDRVSALNEAGARVSPKGAEAGNIKSNLASEAKKVEAELGAIEESLAKEFPRYAELVQPKAVTVEELQTRLLRPNEALLVFVLLPEQAAIFAVTRDRFALQVRPGKRAEIVAGIRAIRRGAERIAAGDSIAVLRETDPAGLNFLYRELVAPVEDVLKGSSQVLVVGDGALNTLPLEALVVRYDEKERQEFASARAASDGAAATPLLGEYARLSYLGERYRFAYLPSLAALVSQRQHQPPPPAFEQQFVSFADPVFGGEEGRRSGDYSSATRSALSVLGRGVAGERGGSMTLRRLKETADEAREIAAILGGKHSLYLREQAQERIAKSGDLGKARFLHFATHGFLGGEYLQIKDVTERERAGFFSFFRATDVKSASETAQPALALTLVGDLQGEDGLLTMKEIIENLSINAELVVLSACNTAGEHEAANNGEGFAGLTRAFMFAGAKALVVSHWAVESRATQALMTEMFRELGKAIPAPAALDAARQKVRGSAYTADNRTVSRAHPYFWAPFVYVGD